MADNTASVNNDSTPEMPSAFSLFKPSWEGLKLNILEFILIYLVPAVILGAVLFGLWGSWAIGTGAISNVDGGAVVAIVISGLLLLAFAALVGPALVYAQLKSARLEKASYQEAWEISKKFWWRFLLLSIAVGVTIVIGLILLIVPGIIFLRRYFLSQYAMIDQDLSVGDSMRASNELSRGRSMAIFGIIGVDILISLPNFIPLIGGIVTAALQIAYFCAPAIRYEQLKALRPVAAKS
jgi:hypothetical protein